MRSKNSIYFIVLSLFLIDITLGEDDISEILKQYDANIASCELSTLQLGTEIADVFNAPIGNEDWNERVHQDKIIEKLGFAPWTANGVAGSGGKTLEGHDAKAIFEKAGWGGKNIAESPYAILDHKWIYMLGDSTTRQIWASFASPFQGNNFERNAKEWSRHYCNGQPHRKRHSKHGEYDDEGWRGPCGVNEVTCHVSGYGDRGVLSFDWKHFPYEDYDEYLFGTTGPFQSGFPGEGLRRPDILTVQLGMHSCWHAIPEGLYSKHLTEINQTMIDAHLNQIPILMKSIRTAIDTIITLKPGITGTEMEKQTKTTVIFLTSGNTGMLYGGINIDTCIIKFNQAIIKYAHEYGFSVLDRGEIEHRLMHKSVFSENPILHTDMHLPQPGQNLVSTTLLHMITCLNKTMNSGSSGSSMGYEITGEMLLKRPKHQHNGGQAQPLHSPPAG